MCLDITALRAHSTDFVGVVGPEPAIRFSVSQYGKIQKPQSTSSFR